MTVRSLRQREELAAAEVRALGADAMIAHLPRIPCSWHHYLSSSAKQIIKAFYGERPKYSYFFGCSTGGGQGVYEALQFPGDYDGIVAGSPQLNSTHHAAGNIWDYQAFNGPANITAT